jgi:hypothetical protein
VSKVSGDLVTAARVAYVLAVTFLRLALQMRSTVTQPAFDRK